MNKQGTSAVKIGSQIGYLLHEQEVKAKYLKLASDVIQDETICIRKKKERIKELGTQQEQELKGSAAVNDP